MLLFGFMRVSVTEHGFMSCCDLLILCTQDKPRLSSTETVFKSKLLFRHQPNYWKFSYVPSMTYLVLPFANVMSELDAFFAFTTFVRHCCPLYVQPNSIGARCGAKVWFARCLILMNYINTLGNSF
jgi:hypothetical protein